MLLGVLVALASAGSFAPSALAGPSPYLKGDQILVNHYAEIESEKLGGLTLPGGVSQFITVRESSQRTLPEQGPDGTVFPGAADTSCTDSNGAQVGPSSHCTITIATAPHDSNSRGERTKDLTVISAEIGSVIAHEVFHCYQTVMAGTLANFNRPGETWLIEGSATWVESDLVPDDTGAREEWANYLRSPSVSLFKRTYSAIGFFEHLQSSGISPWSRFPAMFATTSNAAAYNVSVSLSAKFLSSDASSFFREPAFGSAWDQQGPDVPTPAEVGFKPTELKLTRSATVPLSVAAYTDGVYHVSLEKLPTSTPLLEVQVAKGYVRLHSTDGGDVDEVEPTELTLCADAKGCDCPGQPPTDSKPFKQGDLAITGGSTGGDVQLIPRPRCETLLPPRSCEELLPGFSIPLAQTLENATQQHLALESGNRAAGEYVYVCLFPGAKGGEVENAEGNSVFDGVVATVAYVKRYPSVAEAKLTPTAAAPGATPSSVPGIGDEAEIMTTESSSNGETGYSSVASVRVHNVDAGFSILSSGGSTEADGQAARALLSQVAAELDG